MPRVRGKPFQKKLGIDDPFLPLGTFRNKNVTVLVQLNPRFYLRFHPPSYLENIPKNIPFFTASLKITVEYDLRRKLTGL